MLPRFARAELRVGGSPRAKFLWKIFILRGEWRRREIRPPKVCVFHLSVNQYCRENTLQNGSNFGSLPHPYTSISGWILPHVFLHYPKDPRNAFRWDLNILLNCGVPYPAVSCSARARVIRNRNKFGLSSYLGRSGEDFLPHSQRLQFYRPGRHGRQKHVEHEWW